MNWCVDVLVSRGYSRREALEDMYWEDFWEAVELAANSKVMEQNADFKFHFMLHVDKKSKDAWEDSPLPFPAKEEVEKEDKKAEDVSGIEQLPPELRGLVYRPT